MHTGVLLKSLGHNAGALDFAVGCIGSAHAPVFQATIVIPGFGGMMGDVVGRGDAPNKKMAEKMAALDACVKLAQLGRLAHVPKPASRAGGGGGGGKGAKKAPVYAGDVGAVPLCSSRLQLEELCRIAQTLAEVPSKPIEPSPARYEDEEEQYGRRPDREAMSSWNRRHIQLQEEREQKAEYRRIRAQREVLPAFAMRDTCIHTIAANQVTIVAGDTGCGKTTQVPQAYFDHEVSMGRGGECHVVVTQPRRVSAISVAERVAQERGERIGETVGYQIRYHSMLPSSSYDMHVSSFLYDMHASSSSLDMHASSSPHGMHVSSSYDMHASSSSFDMHVSSSSGKTPSYPPAPEVSSSVPRAS
jgi:hypothetical protein